MTAVLATVVGILGLAVGSFLTKVVARVPQHELPVGARSRCVSCGVELSGGDVVPVLSWVLLRARCRTCRARISVRYPALELACAALFAGTAVRFGLSYPLPAYLVLAAGLLALSVIDLEHQLLPNRIVYPTGYAAGLLLFLAALAEAEPRRVAWALIGAGGSFGLFFLLHFLSPGGMAFGDVRLSFVLGMAVGWLGLALVPLYLFTAIPFGPFLALGAEVAVFVGRPLVDAYLGS